MASAIQKFQLCLTSVDSKATAKKIAYILLQQKLVACVNITNELTSLYHWKNKIVEDNELLMIMKTTLPKVAELKKQLLSLHPYETPEFIQIEINDGDENYLDWIAKSVKD